MRDEILELIAYYKKLIEDAPTEAAAANTPEAEILKNALKGLAEAAAEYIEKLN